MITPNTVKKFWKEALDYFEVESVNKNDSDFMSFLGQFLDCIGIIDKDDFKKRFAITIGGTIYIPFEIGVPDEAWSLEDQVLICPHELVHTMQFRKTPEKFVIEYLFNPSIRAEAEAEAFSADLEVYYYLNGELYDIKSRAQELSNYNLEQRHIDYVVLYLESIGETIVQGASVSDVASWALNWFESNGIKPKPILQKGK